MREFNKIPDNYNTILLLLKVKAQKGEVLWEKITTESVYGVRFKNYTLVFEHYYHTNSRYKVSLMDSKGHIIDYFCVNDYMKDKPSIIQELYVLARRSLNDIENVIAEIMKELY